MRETKPICTPGTAEAVPLGARRPERRGATVPRPPSLEPIMRNEPNFHRDRGRDTPSFHHSIVPGFQSPAADPGGDRAKQSQLPWSDAKCKHFAEREL